MPSNEQEKKRYIYALTLTIVILFSLQVSANAQQTCTVYIYDKFQSSVQPSYINYFKISNCNMILRDLNSSWNSFSKIVETLMILGVQITSPEDCVSCIREHQMWNEMLKNYASPLIVYIHEGRLTAITLGITDIETLKEALSYDGDYVKIFSRHGEYSFKNESVRMIEELVYCGKAIEISVQNIIWPLVLLAVTDSVNPCTFAAFTALLLVSLHLRGKKTALISGLFFIIAVFLSYYILGVGLIYLFARISYVDKIVALFGLVIGAIDTLIGLRPEFKSSIPKSISGAIDSWIRNTFQSPIMSFLLGIAISFTLLPCSGGPYVVASGLLSTFKDEISQYLLLTIYNLIFIAPLVTILIAVLLIKGYAGKIKVIRSKNLGIMELISGLLLVIISVYLLLS